MLEHRWKKLLTYEKQIIIDLENTIVWQQIQTLSLGSVVNINETT
jgi:hypothetical protein